MNTFGKGLTFDYLHPFIIIVFVIIILIFGGGVQDLIIQPRLSWDSLCSPGWPQTHDPPASGSHVLGLQSCTIIFTNLHFGILWTGPGD